MDTLTTDERSERMRSVRAQGNRSTEWRVRAALMACGIRGWTLHDRSLPGCPDFTFPGIRIAVFVDGCFWHGCPECKRPLPRSNRAYWRRKIAGNRSRAAEVNRRLRSLGYTVLRIWEHDARRWAAMTAILRRLIRF